MKKIIINGLDVKNTEIFLTFMKSKLSCENYIFHIEEVCGNDCNMEWIEDGMDISDDDMVHSLFELYGIERSVLVDNVSRTYYTLKINDDITFETYKVGCEFIDKYLIK